MILGAVADIHFRYKNNDQDIDRIVADLENCDAIVIAGDIHHDPAKYYNVLSRFDHLKAEKLVTLGNHDLYSVGPDSFNVKIPVINEICKRWGFTLLDSSPSILDGIAFVGNMGWYDYAFADTSVAGKLHVNGSWKTMKELTDDDFATKTMVAGFGRSVWNDVNYIKTELTDKQILRSMETRLRQHLQQVEDEGAEKIIYVSHHIPHPCFVYQKAGDIQWAFFNAYQGSPRLGEIALSHPNLTTVICGHSHIQDHAKVGDVDLYNVSSEGSADVTKIEL